MTFFNKSSAHGSLNEVIAINKLIKIVKLFRSAKKVELAFLKQF